MCIFLILQSSFQAEDVSEAEGAMYLERAAKHGNVTAVLALAHALYGYVLSILYSVFRSDLSSIFRFSFKTTK